MNRQKMSRLGLLATGIFFGLNIAAAQADDYQPGDAAKGEKLFKKCSTCHEVGADAKNKVGPHLNDLFGRTAGALEDYKYGKSLKKAGEEGLVWTEEETFAFLKNPRKYLRKRLDDKKAKSKMTYKLKKEDQRADIIAYLKTFSKSE